MPKTRMAVFVATLVGIAALTATYSRSQTPPGKKQGRGATPATGWQANPEWMKTKYGDWGGPGVNAGAGPMDTILLKDWAPKSSIVVPETPVPKAKYPAIDVHAHVNARSPAEVAAWVKTMDEVGIQTTVILSSATGAQFD